MDGHFLRLPHEAHNTFCLGPNHPASKNNMATARRRTTTLWILACLALKPLSSGGEAPTNNDLPTLPAPRTRIVGGFDAAQDRFPYGQVSLRTRHGQHQCGGSIVAVDMILTAGHCMSYFNQVRVGEYDKSSQATNKNEQGMIQDFSSVVKIRHPQFEASLFRFDVMLVKLESPITGVTPIQLNDNANLPSVPFWMTLIGWGTIDGSTTTTTTARSSGTFPDILQQAYVPYIPNAVCENGKYSGQQVYKDEIFSEMLCAGQPGVDACSGDSGSPLIHEGAKTGEDIQMGLVSWGRGCGKHPGVYTRISEVFPWIRKEICWYSLDPPAYLNCGVDEVGTTNPTAVPTPQVSTLDRFGGRDVDGLLSPSDDANNDLTPSNGTRVHPNRLLVVVCLFSLSVTRLFLWSDR